MYDLGVAGLIFWVSGPIFWVSELIFWVSELILWVPELIFWVPEHYSDRLISRLKLFFRLAIIQNVIIIIPDLQLAGFLYAIGSARKVWRVPKGDTADAFDAIMLRSAD